MVGLFRAGRNAGDAWTVTDDGGAVHEVVVTSIISANAIGPRAVSPEMAMLAEQLDQQALLAARERSQAASAIAEIARVGSAQSAAAEEQRRAVFELVNEQGTRFHHQANAANEAAAVERQTQFAAAQQERLQLMNAATAAAEERRRDAMAAEARERRAADAHHVLLGTVAGLATELRALSSRVERLSTQRTSPSPDPAGPPFPHGSSPVPPLQPPPPIQHVSAGTTPLISAGSTLQQISLLPALPRQASVVRLEDVTHPDVAVAALLRHERKEAAKEGWSSHWQDLPKNRQVFGQAHLAVLSVLPEIYFPSTEADLDLLRDAVVRIATAAIALTALPPTTDAIEKHMVSIIRSGPGRELQALQPATYDLLTTLTAVWLEATSPTPRARALFKLAVWACRFSLFFAGDKQRARLERIELAALCTRPSGSSQVSRWASKAPQGGAALAEHELPLAVPCRYPVRVAGPALF